MSKLGKAAVAVAAVLSAGALAAGNVDKGVRTIRLVQDDAQSRMASKLYELRNARATDVRPFVEAAVKRYAAASKVERVNYPEANRQMFLVTTGEDFLPYVDEIVAELDAHAVKDDKRGVTTFEGTGVTRGVYRPKWRSGEDIASIVGGAVNTGEGATFFNPARERIMEIYRVDVSRRTNNDDLYTI